MLNTKPKIGIGSFAFRYAVGSGSFRPQRPMSTMDFLVESHRMGFEGIQLCENLGYSKLGNKELTDVKEKARELDMFVEVGMKDIVNGGLDRHLEIAEIMSSKFLRIVLGRNAEFPETEKEREELIEKSIHILNGIVPYCEKNGLRIGIENHFDLPAEDIVRIIEEVGSRWIGLIFDSTNGIGFIEKPEATMKKFARNILSVHLKDFDARKVEAGYLITGTVLGEGWLDVDRILKTAFEYNPNVSIILEMTVRRDEKQTAEEVLHWERTAIEKSLFNLREKINKLI